jgi:hypothetical protein
MMIISRTRLRRVWALSRNFRSSAFVVTLPWPGTTVSKPRVSAVSSVRGHAFALPPPA